MNVRTSLNLKLINLINCLEAIGFETFSLDVSYHITLSTSFNVKKSRQFDNKKLPIVNIIC